MATSETLTQQARQLGAGLDSAFGRRLNDRVLLAFHQACEQQDVEVARRLLDVLDFMWLRDVDAPWGRRRNVNYLVPARERFWHLLYVAQSQPPGMNAGPDDGDSTRSLPSANAMAGDSTSLHQDDGPLRNASEPAPPAGNRRDDR